MHDQCLVIGWSIARSGTLRNARCSTGRALVFSPWLKKKAGKDVSGIFSPPTRF